jgi:hypothetical protein
MIKNVLIIFFLLSLSSCENAPEQKEEVSRKPTSERSRFPSVLQHIFQSHGELNNWEQMKRLSFSVDNSNAREMHTINLKSRNTLIESDVYTIGFDGDNVWLRDDYNNFNGNARFYYNQMFYLFSMPFIVSDPGIFYTERKDTTLEFETYGTLHIGFRRSVGASPQDEYIIYYNKKTMEMAWLGYTVTYFDKKRSTDWHFIKYDGWQEVNGLKIPKTIVKYETVDDKPHKPINTIEFFDVKISEQPIDQTIFDAIKGSRFVE